MIRIKDIKIREDLLEEKVLEKAWTSSGNKIGDIKTMDLYIKPEESAVYYVINGTSTGAVAF